jgi:SAM-dependent methyltransferase
MATSAESEALARLYDVDLLEDPGDLDLYRALAARTGGPILELGVGTGRLAVPLAAAGFAVTGIDLDPAMLARARARAASEGRGVARRLTFTEGDARRATATGGPFGLVFIALNTLLVFGNRADQAAALRTMAEHLAPEGLAVVDVWLPDAEQLSRYDGRLGLEYVRRDPETGNRVTKLASAYHDAALGTVALTAIFDEGLPGAPAKRWVREDRLRLVGADELRVLAEDAGLVVEVLAGDYDLAPIGAGDERAILVATRTPSSTVGRSKRGSGLV